MTFHNKLKRFFILGCQRSGTTLLRLILDSHSKISCADENISYEVLSDSNKFKNFLEVNNKMNWTGFKIPRLTEQINNSIIHDYGLSTPMQNFYEMNPLIFIIRDCRDVICSMKNLKDSENVSWLEKWGIPIVNYWIENSPDFKQKFDSDINNIKDSKNYELAMAALYWKFKNDSYFRYVKLNYPIIKISYEKLVTNPNNTIMSMLHFLDLEWEDSVLKHHTIEHSEIDKDGYTIGRTNAHNPINISSVGQYKKELDSEQLNSIISISGELMKKFDYL